MLADGPLSRDDLDSNFVHIIDNTSVVNTGNLGLQMFSDNDSCMSVSDGLDDFAQTLIRYT